MSYTIEQTINGHVYLYRVNSYWDKEKKQPRQHRIYIGKKDDQSGLPVPSDDINDAREFGSTFLLRSITQQLGLHNDLAAVFPDSWKEILALAFYRVCENKALYLCESWLDTVWMQEPVNLPSPRITELLGQIGYSTVFKERFFRRWSGHCAKPHQFIVFDITSISSYAKGIDTVEWGYNRDHEALPQVNLGLVYSEPSALPLCYTVYPGSIHDVTTLRNTVLELEMLSQNKSLFVLDKGFYSQENLRHMRGMHFVIPLPARTCVYRELVSSVQGKLRSAEYAIGHGEHVYYVIRERIELAGMVVTAHIYLDEQRQTDGRRLFLHSLFETEAAVRSLGLSTKHQIEEYLADQVPDLVHYFSTRKHGPGSILVRSAGKIDRKLGGMGIFILIANSDLSSEELLNYYRERDGIEKHFDSLKNNLFFKRIRVHSQQTMEGLLFIEFIAMILRSRINKVAKSSKALASLCVPELLFELRKLKQITFGKKKALTEISKKQKDIFSAFKINLSP
jgi:transposase